MSTLDYNEKNIYLLIDIDLNLTENKHDPAAFLFFRKSGNTFAFVLIIVRYYIKMIVTLNE